MHHIAYFILSCFGRRDVRPLSALSLFNSGYFLCIGTKADRICVTGIVNVKVVGSVENGERIYASPTYPGKAMPQSHMPVGSFLRKKHVLLGMALETKKSTKILDEVQLVKCFVCVILDVSRKELLEEIEDLYEANEKRTEEQIKFACKRSWKSKCFILFTIQLANN